MRTKEFERALVEVISRQPFFRRLLLETVFDEDVDIPTACVSGNGTFKVNPEWFKSISDCDRVFVILHEVLHIALCHFTRLGQKNRFLWNVATDLAINSMLRKMGFKVDKLANTSLFPERFQFDDCLSAEEYYKLLERSDEFCENDNRKSNDNSENGKREEKEKSDRKESKSESEKEGKENSEEERGKREEGKESKRRKKGKEGEKNKESKEGKKDNKGGESDEGREGKEKGDDEGKEGKENDKGKGGNKVSKFDKFKGFDEHKIEKSQNNKEEKTADEIERKYKRVLISAYEESGKQKGQFPGWFEELIERLKEPKLDWKSMLRKFCIQNIRVKSDWTKPNRRYFAYDIIYPSRRDKMLNLVIAIDTSGSISSEDLKDFFSEINGILSSFNYYHVYLIQNDAKIQKVEEIKYPNKLSNTIEIIGRGGTDFRPVFKYLEEKRIKFPLIFFTDLFGDFPDKSPQFPVLWITKSSKKAPWGITIKYRR